MGSLYTGTSVSGYNSNPPPDDGTTGANNQVTWVAQKSKLGDPLNTAIAAMSSALVTALNKTISGGSVVSTAVDYPASAADQGRNIVVTVSGKTVTTPDATSVLSPFVFAVNNQSSGNITVAGFSAQNIDGANTAKLGKGRGIILWTDGVNWFSSGLVMGNLPLANPPFGFDAPINLQLNATVGSSLLTVAVKANDGTDPTSSNPVLIPFRDSTLANGGPVWVAVTAALSINTNSVGASLGAANGVTARFWVVAFNNAGTVVLGLINCLTSTSATPGPGTNTIVSINETNVQSSAAISAAATSGGVFYTPNGTTVTSKAIRILGYVETVEATAGTYATAPSVVQLFGPGIKRPGDIIQTIHQTFNNNDSTASTSFVATSSTTGITPQSAANAVYYSGSGYMTNNGAGAFTTTVQMTRGTTPQIGRSQAAQIGAAFTLPYALIGIDTPGANIATNYTVYQKTSNASGSATCVNSVMTLMEIMG